MAKLRLRLLWLFIIKLTQFLDGPFKSTVFSIPPWFTMLLRFDVPLSHIPIYCFHYLIFNTFCPRFQRERVNGIPLSDYWASDFQRALKIMIIAELFIVMTISPGHLIGINFRVIELTTFRGYLFSRICQIKIFRGY